MNGTMSNDPYTQAANWVIDAAKRKPEGLLVLAAGLALLLRSGKSAVPNYDNSPPAPPLSVPEGGWGVSRAAESVSGYATQVKDQVAGAASSVSDYAGTVGRTISDQGTRLAGQTQTAASKIMDQQPLAVAVFGVAAGAALAALLPSTEMEVRALGPTREAITDAAGKVGENLIDAAGDAGERLKQGAAEIGLSPDGIKGLAHDVADTFTNKISGNSETGSGHGAS